MKIEKIPVIHTEDLPTLLTWRLESLRDQFGDLTAADEEKLLQESRAYFLRHVPSGNHYAVLASPGGEAVGCGALNFYSSMPGPENPTGACADIVNVYVRPEFRGQGVATAIVNHLKDIARRAGVSRIYIKAREAASSLFAHEGFVPLPGVMTALAH